MDRLGHLIADGLELLGEIDLGPTAVIGDPSTFAGEPDRVVLRTRPGRWLLLGRAFDADPDQLEELVAVHAAALELFYDLYDAAAPRGVVLAASGRYAALDGAAAVDPTLWKAAFEPEELPWILDRGLVMGVVEGGPARVVAGPDPVALFAVTSGPDRPQGAPSSSDVFDGGFESEP